MGLPGKNPEYGARYYDHAIESGSGFGLSSTARQIVLPDRKIIFVGAISEIGTGLTMKFIEAGREVIPTTRSLNKLERLQKEISAEGRTVNGLVLDLTNEDQVRATYNALDLAPREPVHLLLWSVGTMDGKLVKAILRSLASTYHLKEDSRDLKDRIKEATESIREVVQAPGVLDDLSKVNKGQMDIVRILGRNGHLAEDSIISTMASSGSDLYNPSDPDSYRGSWTYYPIAKPKGELDEEVEREAKRFGCRKVKFTATEVAETAIASLFKKLRGRLTEKFEGVNLEMPTIEILNLVETLFNQLMYVKSRKQIENRYVRGLNDVTLSRPKEWEPPEGWDGRYPF